MQTERLLKLLVLASLCCGAALQRCDCRTSWWCPWAVVVPPVRTCQVNIDIRGYCCPLADRTTPRATPQTTPRTKPQTTPRTKPQTTPRTTPQTTPRAKPRTKPRTTPRQSRDCRPLVLCPAALADPQSFSGLTCPLPDSSKGVKCSGGSFSAPQKPTVGNRDGISGRRRAMQPLGDTRMISESFMTLAGGDQQAAMAFGARTIQQQTELGTRLSASDRGSTVGIFNLNFRSSSRLQTLGMSALRNLMTLTSFNGQGGGDMVQLVSRFGSAAPGDAILPATPARIPGCENEEPIVCTASKYRTANGECNNLQRPRQGRSLTGFKRMLPNTYEDGIFAIRNTSVTGRSLPSPRLISERVVETISHELSGFTLSVVQWGQFLDHDFNHALIFQLPDGGAIECCQNGGRTLPSSLLHPQCIPIEIPADDPFYSQFDQRCMSLVRSLPTPESDCIARPATPINELTAYLDASMLYGSGEEETSRLRSFKNGLLIVSRDNLLPLANRPAAPRQTNPIKRSTTLSNGYLFSGSDRQFSRGRRGRRIQRPQTTSRPPPLGEEAAGNCVDHASICFRGGESRVNEQSSLTVMHTVFTREHNRVATALRRRHGNWDDERLFQETRRVVIAEWQHIIYNEWLPIVVGFDYARDHDLLPLYSGFSSLYDSTVDASASNEFATAAFRFGHSLLSDMYHLINAQGRVTRTFNLTRTFFDPSVVASGLVDHARAMVARRPETFDRNVVSSVHEQLFTSNFRFGLDLIALNIQRGRDHGIPTYTSVLGACNNVTVTRWSDLNRLMDSSAIDQLRAVYADPRDVDLFIGGLSERRARGAQVGPTFQCLIGQQFFDVRYGDRFFYDIGGFEHSFSAAQLAEIRKSSWARIMCDTLGPEFEGDFNLVQPLAFVESSVGPNGGARCNSDAIPTMNLDVF